MPRLLSGERLRIVACCALLLCAGISTPVCAQSSGNPLWPALIRVDGDDTSGATVPPARFAFNRNVSQSGVVLSVVAAGTPVCLVVAVVAGVATAPSTVLFGTPGSGPDPYSSLISVPRVTVSTETFRLPWTTGKVNQTIVVLPRRDTAVVEVYPCNRLTSPGVASMFGGARQVDVLGTSPPTWNVPSNLGAVVLSSAAAVNVPTAETRSGWLKAELVSTSCECNLNNFPSQSALGGFLVFDAAGEMVTPPTTVNGAEVWQRELHVSPAQVRAGYLSTITVVARTCCDGTRSSVVGAALTWVPDTSDTFADDISLTLIWPIKTGCIMLAASVVVLILGVFCKDKEDDSDENPASGASKLLAALGCAGIVLGVLFIMAVVVVSATVATAIAITTMVLLLKATASCGRQVLRSEQAIQSKYMVSPTTKPQSVTWWKNPKRWVKAGSYAVQGGVVLLRSLARFGIDLLRVRVLAALMGSAYGMTPSGWDVVPAAFQTPFATVAHAVVGWILSTVELLDVLTAWILRFTALLEWLTNLNCSGPASTGFAGVAVATGCVLLYVTQARKCAVPHFSLHVWLTFCACITAFFCTRTCLPCLQHKLRALNSRRLSVPPSLACLPGCWNCATWRVTP